VVPPSSIRHCDPSYHGATTGEPVAKLCLLTSLLGSTSQARGQRLGELGACVPRVEMLLDATSRFLTRRPILIQHPPPSVRRRRQRAEVACLGG
jgi:hypothetical protein